MAVKFPPPPYLTTQNPDTQRLNRWLLEIQSILNSDGTVDIGISPTLLGVPTASTAAPGTNTAQLATTAFVLANSGGVPSTTVPLVDATPGLVGTSTHFARADHVHPTDTSRAPLASPVLTGTPKAPTPTLGDNSTDIATTAFVQSAVGSAGGHGVAVAWAYLTQTGGTYTLAASFAVSGFTKTSTGIVNVTLSVPMASTNFAAVAMPNQAPLSISEVLGSRTTTNVRLEIVNSAGTPTDGGFSVVLFA
jgi:hypothetical protein